MVKRGHGAWVHCYDCGASGDGSDAVMGAAAVWNRRSPAASTPDADTEREAQRLDWRDASIALENAGCIGSSRLAQVQELIAQRDAAVERMRQLEDERQEREGLAAELIAWAAHEASVIVASEIDGDPYCVICGAWTGIDNHDDDCPHLRARMLKRNTEEE